MDAAKLERRCEEMRRPQTEKREDATAARHPLADLRCQQCVRADGVATGYRWRKKWRGGEGVACGCVYRRAFRIAMRKVEEIIARYPPEARLEIAGMKGQGAGRFSFTYSMPAVELLADVELTARRELGAARWPLFEMHYLRREQWFECLPKLAKRGLQAGVDRGNFFHECYAVELQLGKLWIAEGLVPLYRYFRGRNLTRSGFVNVREGCEV